jgi:predicted membrane protein
MFENAGRRGPAEPQKLAFGNVSIPGTKVGAIVAATLVIIAWIALPGAILFILGTVCVGALVGLGLSWRHSRE